MKRFGLSANERIKSRKDFEEIFSNGKTFFSSDRKIKVTYLIAERSDKTGIVFSAAVFKKAGKAVWRNRAKRLIKEAYRLNKKVIKETAIERGLLLMLVFSPSTLNEKQNKKLYIADVMPGVKEILLKLKDKL
ncbi:MAG: ribonuclease P protein component [Ignavibacteriaceae bacterium]